MSRQHDIISQVIIKLKTNWWTGIYLKGQGKVAMLKVCTCHPQTRS